jgi:hypothetical protein
VLAEGAAVHASGIEAPQISASSLKPLLTGRSSGAGRGTANPMFLHFVVAKRGMGFVAFVRGILDSFE